MRTLDVFRTSVAAAALGFARRALDEATQRATTRRHVQGGVLVRLPAHAGQARRRWRSTIDSRRACSSTAPRGSATRASNVTREAAMAKLAATEGAQQVIDAAVQILGGRGVRQRRAGRAALPRDPLRCASTKAPAKCSRLIIGRELLKAHASEGDDAMNEASASRRLAAAQGLCQRRGRHAAGRCYVAGQIGWDAFGRVRDRRLRGAGAPGALPTSIAVLHAADARPRAHRAHDLVRHQQARVPGRGPRDRRAPFARSSAVYDIAMTAVEVTALDRRPGQGRDRSHRRHPGLNAPD